MGWEVYPPGLYEVLKRVYDDYSPSRLLITENGAAYDDVVDEGQVDDPEREAFLHEHLLAGLPRGRGRRTAERVFRLVPAR